MVLSQQFYYRDGRRLDDLVTIDQVRVKVREKSARWSEREIHGPTAEKRLDVAAILFRHHVKTSMDEPPLAAGPL
jgi:hypothetical protein